jgi:flavoprotein
MNMTDIKSEMLMSNKMKIAWGITGSGDKIRDTFEMMYKLSQIIKKIMTLRYLSQNLVNRY